jgi:TDG/mug DNA glycosylase family protein
MAVLAGLPPLAAGEPRVLVLGSFPSARSLETGRYYGHVRNHFWEIMAAVLGLAMPEGYEERKRVLAEAGIAVWDLIASCERAGSLDKDIRGETLNPIIGFLADRPSISRIALNGGKAAEAFARGFASDRGQDQGPGRRPAFGRSEIGRAIVWEPIALPGRRILVARLPSTSPVPTRRNKNAADKVPEWKAFLTLAGAAAS